MSQLTEKAGSVMKALISPLLSVIALTLSCYSLYNSDRTHQDVARSDAIKTEHDLFNNLAKAKMDYPLMTHLFATSSEDYDSSVSQVAAAAFLLDPPARAKLVLEEKGMAHFIFTAFEETYYNWEHAEMVGDKARASLLREDLGYFTDALRNPRLLWYWDADNGKRMAFLFAPKVQKYYADNILNDCREVNDPDGPFTPEVVRLTDQKTQR